MLLMSTTTSMVLLCQSSFNNLLVSANSKSSRTSFSLSFSLFSSQKNLAVLTCTKSRKRSRLCSCSCSCSRSRSRSRSSSLVPNAKERKKTRKQSWWYKFFLDDDGNWLGLKEDDMQDLLEQVDEDDDINSNDDDSKFEAWKQRAQAITELREAQEDMRNQEARSWEDWLAHDDSNGNGIGTFDSSSSSDWFNFNGGDNGLPPQSTDPTPQNGLVRSVRNFLLGSQDDTNDDDDDDADLLYEDRVFRYASINSAKFLVVLIFVPWALDFLFHDYLLMPFLDRYVKTVPLAAQMLDVRRNQKLEIIEQLKMEKARLRLEVQIGKSPPLSDDQAWWELRDKALELREEKRLQNRGAFANIWSDMVFGISLFILLYSNQSKVALLKFTGYKIINNISDTGKAFLIILITDIFLGYHSESGWQTLLEIIVEHYGLEVDQSAITIFISLVPVIIDACVKLWLFKFLPRLSPKVANIFREMKRH